MSYRSQDQREKKPAYPRRNRNDTPGDDYPVVFVNRTDANSHSWLHQQTKRTCRLLLVNACLLVFVLCLAVVAFLLWLVV